jgi:amidase
MVPLAGGGDGGGSIRIPASCCGLFGLKPTRGRTPTGPDHGEVWRGFVVEHVITRSVRDSAAMLDATAGPDAGAPYHSVPPSRPFLAETTTEPARLRIAFTAHPFLGTTTHDDCLTGLQETVRLIKALGHDVSEDAPRIDGDACALAFLSIMAAETRADIERTAALAARKPSLADFEVGTYAVGLMGKQISASDYVACTRALQMAARVVGRFFEGYDLLLTPTLAQPPIAIGALKTAGAERKVMELIGRLDAGWMLKALGVIKKVAKKAFAFSPYTPLFNVTGQPAMSVPLHWNRDGLPIGMQFIGRFGDEATLFRLAGQLERAQPWFNRLPQMPGTDLGRPPMSASKAS